MLDNKFSLGFFITAGVYILSLGFAPYSLQFGVKVLPIIILLATTLLYAKGQLRLIVAAAVIASGIGDVMLALPIENSFIFGLGAFFIAQVTYAFCFFHFRHKTAVPLNSKIVIGLLILYSLAMATYVLPSTSDMLIPVSAYLTVITLMGITALSSGLHSWVTFGALFFVASDSALALSLFKTPLPFSSHIVMFTYYAAQFLIVGGLLKSSIKQTQS
ncbi:lysoplasmalogenase [Thalassotalea atypica]|uniref:lysoplasmalogenase n=1 Tax=Thalassotalea atypica TaxID=2054316 RepID=UPI002573E2AD|nr:lysoplasmalogenase [Thalassotalea atypica]